MIDQNKIDLLKKVYSQSLFQFAKYVCGFEDLVEKYHGEWSKPLQSGEKRILNLQPRGLYKTSLVTIAHTIWWHAFKDNNCRTLILHQKYEKGIEYLRAIAAQYTQNETLRLIIGDQKTSHWNKDELALACYTNYTAKEKSIKASGFDSDFTGGHYDIIKLDDSVTLRDWVSGARRIQTQRNFENLMATVEDHTIVIINGTRWHIKDLYNHIITNIIPKVPYYYMCGDIQDDNGKSKFPEIIDNDRLQDIKAEVNNYVFNANYRNRPLEDFAHYFDIEKLNYFHMSELNFNDLEIYKSCDPAFGKSKKACYSPIITGAFDRKRFRLYIIDIDMKQRTFETLTRDVILNILQQPCRMFYGETNFNQGAFFDGIQREVDRWQRDNGRTLGYHFQGNPSRIDKDVRIKQMQLRDVYFRVDYESLPDYDELMQQLGGFPNHEFKDGPDGLEQLIRMVLNASTIADSRIAIEPITIKPNQYEYEGVY